MTPEERADLIRELVIALANIDAEPQLLTDERRWVRLAIKREEERAVFRKAVITKSIGALVVSGVLWLATEAGMYIHHVFARAP